MSSDLVRGYGPDVAVAGYACVWYLQHRVYGMVTRMGPTTGAPFWQNLLGGPIEWYYGLFYEDYEALRGAPMRTPLDIAPASLTRRTDATFWYAILGTLVWGRIFGLPMARRQSPDRIDAIVEPALDGRLGCVIES